MLNFLRRVNPLNFGIDKFRLVIKKRAEMLDVDIAVFVYGSGEYGASIREIEIRNIRSTTKEGNTNRCLRNNHT